LSSRSHLKIIRMSEPLTVVLIGMSVIMLRTLTVGWLARKVDQSLGCQATRKMRQLSQAGSASPCRSFELPICALGVKNYIIQDSRKQRTLPLFARLEFWPGTTCIDLTEHTCIGTAGKPCNHPRADYNRWLHPMIDSQLRSPFLSSCRKIDGVSFNHGS
jgi:hypothetical protein